MSFGVTPGKVTILLDVAQGKSTIFVLPFVMKLLISLIGTPFGILSVNIKVCLWPFDDREASLKKLVPGTTGGRENSVCLTGYCRSFISSIRRI